MSFIKLDLQPKSEEDVILDSEIFLKEMESRRSVRHFF